jgi:hypothetical protein
MPAALRAELALVGLHACRDPIDVGNEPAADEAGVVGAVHALLACAFRRLRASRPPIVGSDCTLPARPSLPIKAILEILFAAISIPGFA